MNVGTADIHIVIGEGANIPFFSQDEPSFVVVELVEAVVDVVIFLCDQSQCPVYKYFW